MIETEQSVVVDADIKTVWNYAKEMERWAAIMPGYPSCEIVNEDDSVWVLKVGVGAMVRTVTVNVHVDSWDGPGAVDFTFKLQGDPVDGSGSYRAKVAGPNQTDVALHVRVNGSGPMAPMWEALGAPVLPKFAKSFAEELKGKIEAEAGARVAPATGAGASTQGGSLLARFSAWLRGIWKAVTRG